MTHGPNAPGYFEPEHDFRPFVSHGSGQPILRRAEDTMQYSKNYCVKPLNASAFPHKMTRLLSGGECHFGNALSFRINLQNAASKMIVLPRGAATSE
ncbi:MAG: hypothetical protein JWL63_1677 [Rhodocyclales bacterium]|nr:hypothetical protein [Rhodocyclales bacterium]